MELVTVGKMSVVAVELQWLLQKANYTHCHAHFLSFSVKELTKNVKILGDTLGTACEIIILIKYSPKRENLLGNLKDQVYFAEVIYDKAKSISRLYGTRWTARVECFKRVLDNYEHLVVVLEYCVENDRMVIEKVQDHWGQKTNSVSFLDWASVTICIHTQTIHQKHSKLKRYPIAPVKKLLNCWELFLKVWEPINLLKFFIW